MISAEPHRPYDRPPLSKEYLRGDGRRGRAALPRRRLVPRPRRRAAARRASDGPGCRRAQARARSAACDSPSQLLIATGSRAATAPGHRALSNVHELRTIADARRLRDALARGARLAVIGAGFIGQEVASTARAAGARRDRHRGAAAPLAAVLGDELGGGSPSCTATRASRACSPADRGAPRRRRRRGDRARRWQPHRLRPRRRRHRHRSGDRWLAGSGLDDAWRTGRRRGRPPRSPASTRRATPPSTSTRGSAPTLAPSTGRPPPARAPRPHARCSASTAASAATPSFWSDQHGIRIQYIGHAHGADAVRIDGDPARARLHRDLTRDGRPVAALLVGRPQALPECAADERRAPRRKAA